MVVRGIVAIAIVLLAVSSALPVHAGRSAQAATKPHNYLSYTVCVSPQTSQDVQVRFIVPGPTELLAQFGSNPLAVWIDLSLFDNGFAPGTFVGAGPLPVKFAGGYEFEWDHLVPGRLHYYRLNGLFANGWMEIGRAAFETPDCASVIGAWCYGQPADTAAVDFRVFPAAGVPLARWLDLSLFDNGFAPGTFIGAGPLGNGTAGFRWTGLLPARWHSFRVNALYADGSWRANATRGAFLTPDCRNLATIFPLRT